MTLEGARDKVRKIMHQKDPSAFPNGQIGTSIQELIIQLFRTDEPMASTYIRCADCDYSIELANESTSNMIHCPVEFSGTTSEYCHHVIKHETSGTCDECEGQLDKVTQFNQVPLMLAFSITNDKLIISKKMKIDIKDTLVVFKLRGIIYFGGYHFTSRILASDGHIWFHDGITTGRMSQNVGKTSDFSNAELLTCNGKKAIVALYAQK